MTTPATGVNATSPLQTYLQQQAQEQAATQAAAANGTNANTGLAQATSASTIGSNFNTFINILTTQLQNQDPTNATDPNQFTQELVQFAGVEQQLNTNNDLQTLINLNKNSSGANAALNYIGQYVQGPSTSNEIPLQGSQAELAYNLSTPGSTAQLTVTDANNNVITTLQGSATSGANYLSWNGLDSSGNQMPDGVYKFALTVTNADGSTQTPTETDVIGKVTSLTSNSDGTTSLSLGGMSLLTSGVDAVYTSSSLPASTAPTTTTSTTGS